MKTKSSREIERKFLIKRLPPELKSAPRYSIQQGYLATEPDERHMHLRKKGKDATLTFKTVHGRGELHEEHEIKLTSKQFRHKAMFS